MAINAAAVAILPAVIVIFLALEASIIGVETAEPTAKLGSECGGAAGQTSDRPAAACGITSLPRACSRERVFVLLKPDAVQRGLVAALVGRFEQKGAQLVALKMVQADRKTLEQHYQG